MSGKAVSGKTEGQAEGQADQGDTLANLDKLENELEQEGQGDDETDGLAEEVGADETRALTERKEAAERRQKAKNDAAFAVAFLETVLVAKAPYVELDPAARDQVQERMAAVLEKSGGRLPPWLAPYREEIELGVALGSAGFSVVMQVRQHQAQTQTQAETTGANTGAGPDNGDSVGGGSDMPQSFDGIPGSGPL